MFLYCNTNVHNHSLSKSIACKVPTNVGKPFINLISLDIGKEFTKTKGNKIG